MKILVFKLGAIGDVLMTTPFLRALREKYPDAEIVYYIGEWSSEVLKFNKRISRMEVFDEKPIYKADVKALLALRKRIKKEKFDMAFILEKSKTANLFIWSCGIKERIGFDRNGEGFPNTKNVKYGVVKHEIEYYLELVDGKDKELELWTH